MEPLVETLYLERLPQVLAKRHCRRTKHYADVAEGLWTPAVSAGERSSFWPAQETDVLTAAYAAGMSKDEIRELVRELIEARQQRFAALRARYLGSPRPATGSAHPT